MIPGPFSGGVPKRDGVTGDFCALKCGGHFRHCDLAALIRSITALRVGKVIGESRR
jgi:hypothetical protein